MIDLNIADVLMQG